jgi:hypothetical protein
MSKKVQISLILFMQLFAIAFGYGFFADIVKEEVCIIIYPVNNVFEDTRLTLSQWNNNTDIATFGIKPNDLILLFDAWNPSFVNFLLVCLVFIICLEILAAVLLYLIITTLGQNSASFSPNTYKLHRQFSLLLISQLLCPIICICLPFGALTIVMWIRIVPTKLAGEIGLIAILIYGLSNSLLTIAFVTPYKRHFLDSLSKICKFHTLNMPTQVQPSPPIIVISRQQL